MAITPRNCWRIINNFLDNSPTSLCDETFPDDETCLIVQKEDEANSLNNYFVNRLGLDDDIAHVNVLPNQNVVNLL